MKDWKRDVHFVLVEPRESGNIGATARAMKNMGFKHLRLVKPPEVLKDEARWFARGALDVLDGARTYGTIEDALRDISFVVCTTRRKGRRRGVFLPIEEGAEKIREFALSGRTAVLFGREQRGLYNEELDFCGFMLSIPVQKEQPSLNLAQAVLITAYELSRAGREPRAKAEKGVYASREEIAALEDSISGVLSLLGYGVQGSRDIKKIAMTNLRRFVARAGLMRSELKTLQGLYARIERKLRGE